MSELEKTSTSGDAPDTSGSDQGSAEATSGAQSNPAYDKLLQEKQNHAKANLSLKAQLEGALAENKANKEEKLLATNQHEKVIEIQREEIAKLKGEIQDGQNTIKSGKINSTLLAELKKLGFEDSESNRELALRVIDKNKVDIDPTTNVVIGADESAKAFHAKYSHLGVFGKSKPGVNVTAPGVNQTITDKPVSQMTPSEREEFMKRKLGSIFGG